MIEIARPSAPKSEEVLIDCFIEGRPVVPQSPMGRRDRQDVWTSTVIDRTMGLPRVVGPFELEVGFLVPSHRDPWELPWEVALDNLLKWMLDALEASGVLGDPSANGELVAVHASRRVAGPGEETGAHLVVRGARPGP